MEPERKQYWLDLAKLTLPNHKIPLNSSSISQIADELESDLTDTYPAEIGEWSDHITGFYIYDVEGLILYEFT